MNLENRTKLLKSINFVRNENNIKYKSIEFYNSNKILVENGPTVKYFHENKNKKYIVDFFIPSLNYLVEMKDDHIWHKKQLENGIWKNKMDAINELIKQKNINHSL